MAETPDFEKIAAQIVSEAHAPWFIAQQLRLVWNARGAADDACLSELLTAARSALYEMCHTVAPRDSFTDTVDELDAAISKTESLLESRASVREP